MTNKEKTQLKRIKSLRKIWTINPKSRIVPNKKKQSKTKTKQEFKKEIKGGLHD